MDWRAQYNRMIRTYRRLDDHQRSLEEYDDDLAHFLMDTLHLHDWVHGDPTINGEQKNLVTSLFRDSEFLLVCRSAANGYKHGGRSGIPSQPQSTSTELQRRGWWMSTAGGSG